MCRWSSHGWALFGEDPRNVVSALEGWRTLSTLVSDDGTAVRRTRGLAKVLRAAAEAMAEGQAVTARRDAQIDTIVAGTGSVTAAMSAGSLVMMATRP